ncbi:MAG: hypothetical protein GX931_02985 [Acholeplasmataceae bacterium]|jgi:hypothetical protein|nr:hypothetical protein [Acholeplasmataceae bacterium]
MKKKALKNKEQKEKRQNLIFGIINVGIILTVTITIIAVIVVSLKKKPEEPKEVKRFEDLIHITIDQYEAIINGEAALAPKDYLYSDTYIFIYNKDYDACPLCGELDEDINLKAKKEGKTYNFYVFDISVVGNEGLKDIIANNHLPNKPVLLHLYGSEVLETHIDELAIKTALSKI